MNQFRRKYVYGSADWACFSAEFAEEVASSDTLNALNYYTIAHDAPKQELKHTDIDLISDIYRKIIFRGTRTFLQPEVEEMLHQLFPKKERPSPDTQKQHAVAYIAPESLRKKYVSLSSLAEACSLPPIEEYNPFDPDNPQNEHRFYEQLLSVAGVQLAAYIYPQCRLDALLPKEKANAFRSQRLDFLIMLPNGKGVIFEPGDHGIGEQGRDLNREEVCKQALGIETIRIDNSKIGATETDGRIKEALEKIGAGQFFSQLTGPEYTLLCPFLIHRLEAVLLDALLDRYLIEREDLTIGIHVGNITGAEVAIYSFFKRLEVLWRLYGLPAPEFDQISFLISGAPSDGSQYAEWRNRLNGLELFNLDCAHVEQFEERLDLFIDVSLTATALKPIKGEVDAEWSYCVRNSFRHNRRPRFFAKGTQRWLDSESLDGQCLNPVAQECFRIKSLRDDQVKIISHVLSKGDTIGLLPTGGGKSLCYQMSGLLTPGVCLIVDPIVALMDDQVASLRSRTRVNHVRALHSNQPIRGDSGLFSLLESHLFVFISPERLLRENFRKALFNASQSGYRVGLAVADEAHCVSMWGHDFRPAYLDLADNLRRYASSGSKPPSILALTGTASQLVLIDLARQLDIHGGDAIIRPKTFERKELNYRVLPTHSSKKMERLQELLGQLRKKLKTKDVLTDRYGIIFGITRSRIYDAFQHVAGQQEAELLLCPEEDRPDELGEVSIALYTGSAPKETGASSTEWVQYKQRSFEQFVGGKVRCMVANNALSVGIDHPKIRYVINLEMVASLESYYQQAGRAGREGDESYCDLIFSDDNPEASDAWLNNQPYEGSLGKDIGTLAFFHSSNFPGVEKDLSFLTNLVRLIFHKLNQGNGEQVSLGAPDIKTISPNGLFIDDLGRFIGYLSILGIIEGYSVSGMMANTVYLLELPDVVQKYKEEHGRVAVQLHSVESLHRYYSRYEPTDFTLLSNEINDVAQSKYNGSISMSACEHLIQFVYGKIVDRRRQSIKTMLTFCRRAAKKPKTAREIIRRYFDRSEFSELLEKMRESPVSLFGAIDVLKKIKNYEDAEQLFWDTRRLIDEGMRADWYFISIFSEAYCGRDNLDAAVKKVVVFILKNPNLASEYSGQIVEAVLWIAQATRERHYQKKSFLLELIQSTYEQGSNDSSLRQIALDMIESSELKEDLKIQEAISQQIFNTQLERLLYVTKQGS